MCDPNRVCDPNRGKLRSEPRDALRSEPREVVCAIRTEGSYELRLVKLCDPNRGKLRRMRTAAAGPVLNEAAGSEGEARSSGSKPTELSGERRQEMPAGLSLGVRTDPNAPVRQAHYSLRRCRGPFSDPVLSSCMGRRRRQAVLIRIDARKRMHHVPSGKTVATPARKLSKAAR